MRIAIAAALASLIAVSALAQAPRGFTPPKTPWGDPDLQGTWTSDDYIGVPLQRNPQYGNRLYLTDQEIAENETRLRAQAQSDSQEFASADARITTGPGGGLVDRGRRPPRQTSLIVDPPDGRMPAITADAMTRRQGIGAGNPNPNPASWEDFSYYIRCITRGVAGSILPVIYGNGAQIVQAPGYVMILHEMVHEARVVPLDGRAHVGSSIRTYMGDSRGRWDGNTLVVETTNFLHGKTGIGLNGGGTPTSDALTLTERFTRIEPNVIQYELGVDDPKTFVRPWKIAFPLTQEPGYQNFEYACHEGNYGMHNQLSAARAEDKK
jgi:hypothetical protein